MGLGELLERTIPPLGYELVDWDMSARTRLVRVFIDKPNGVDVEDCARVSNHLTRLFAVENIEFERLEVSSPGLDRPLIRPDDYQLGAYRDHAYPLTRGADPGMVMAELFGRATGYCKGKGGSMHIFDVEHFVLGGYGIVGGQIPLAAGLAFASKYRNDGRVTVCYFGEAAANQGAFHETLNMASKWALPVIFLCENNRYGMGTAFARVSPMPEVYRRAAGYGIRGEPVDGMDVLKMYEAVKDCAAYARSGVSRRQAKFRFGPAVCISAYVLRS